MAFNIYFDDYLFASYNEEIYSEVPKYLSKKE